MDAESGEVIWQADNDFFLVGASDENLYSRDSLNDPETICCISQKDGKELWRMKSIGSYGGPLCENGIVCHVGSDGYKTVDEKTGNVHWESTEKDIYQKIFSKSDKYDDLILSSPLINDYFIFTCQNGNVASINVINGDVKWKRSLDNIVEMMRPKYINGKLFFTIDHKHENYSYILCLDSETGEIISRTDEKITSDGCIGGLISNGYLIGGNKNQIGFYDLEKQEIVHRQKFKGKQFAEGNILSNISVFKKQLIAWDMQTKGIYFFSS
ncbi:MAG: PQQ-binding-like beta-propeller repeat protein [Bacteroidetes bacterium]|nr:PQQ-binding-like beta-propeller repeat protein [Bacteroidota bacterium]